MKEKQYFISVGEPWNFDGPDGENIIKGKFICQFEDYAIFESNHLHKENGVESNKLLLSSRYKDTHSSSLESEGFWVINAGLLPLDIDISLPVVELKKISKFFIIGSLRLEE